MVINYNNLEWFLKGPCIWAMTFLSFVISVVMATIYLRQPKRYSIFTLFAVTIAINGIIIPIWEEKTFLLENIRPGFAEILSIII